MDSLELTASERATQRPLPQVVAGAFLATVGLLAVLAAHPMVCLGLAVVGMVLVRAELSRVVISYTAVVATCIVIAPRLLGDPNPMVAYATETVAAVPDTYAALWISVSAFAGTTASRWRVPIARRRRLDRLWHAPVPAALAVSGVALVSQIGLLATSSIGVPAQLAGGSSGGGYLGLFGTVGALLAAGCLLQVRSEGRLWSGIGGCCLGLVGGHVAATIFTGFRSAAPLLCIALVVTALGSGPGRDGEDRRQRRRSRTKPLLAIAAIGLAVVPLYIVGIALRERQAAGRYYINNSLSVGEATLARLDHRPYLVRAIERRHDPDAKAAVALRDQATAIVPRILYPAKSTVDYHQRVTRVFFYSNYRDAHDYTATPLTPFGDGVVNTGVAGAVVAIGGYVLVLDTVFRRFTRRAVVGGFAMQVAVMLNAFDIGSPVLLDTANLIRTALMVVATLGLARLVSFGAKRVAAAALARQPATLPPVQLVPRRPVRRRTTPGRPAPARSPSRTASTGRHAAARR